MSRLIIYGFELGDHSIAVNSEWLLQSRIWEHDIDGQSDRPAQPLTPSSYSASEAKSASRERSPRRSVI